MAPSSVVFERGLAVSSVEAAGGVAIERIKTNGRVIAAGRYYYRAYSCISCVEAAGGVAIEQLVPLAVLKLPVVLLKSASKPKAEFRTPSMLLAGALPPVAVFSLPVVLFLSASQPEPCCRSRWRSSRGHKHQWPCFGCHSCF